MHNSPPGPHDKGAEITQTSREPADGSNAVSLAVATATKDWKLLERRLAAASTALSTPPISTHTIDPVTRDSAAATLAGSFAPNTLRAYAADWQYLLAWYRLRTGQEHHLPWAPPVFVCFVLDHFTHMEAGQRLAAPALPADIDAALVDCGVKAALGPLAVATLNHRLAFLARQHRAAKLISPSDEPVGREVLRSARRVTARHARVAPRKAPALTRDRMHLLLATCDDSPTGKRDRALLLFGFSTGGRRRSEIADADFANLHGVGLGAYDYLLLFSKTQQDGQETADARKTLRGTAAAAMLAWKEVLERANISTEKGPIFRRISREGRIGGALTDQAVSRIVQKRAQAAGLTEHFTAHSLRSGFVTQAHLDHIPAPEAMRRSNHKSIEVFNSYYRPNPAADDPADNLIDGPVRSRRTS